MNSNTCSNNRCNNNSNKIWDRLAMIIKVSQSNKTNNRKKVGIIIETEKCLLFLYWNVTINLNYREEMALGIPTN